MLSARELATLRGALLYWQEEIAIHTAETAQLYLDGPPMTPLSVPEVAQLRTKLTGEVRYLRWPLEPEFQQQLLTAAELASRDAETPVATLLLPR